MEKLPMCRICLADNVHMYIVVNKNLHGLYEKLTNIPFVTEDSRPILACFICCAQLKKCYQLLTKCLKAEERFAQIMNGNYEPKPLINVDHLEICHGFIKSPIETISIIEVGQTESISVKEELQVVCEGLDDIIEPDEEHSSDDNDVKTVNLYDKYLDIEDVQLQSHHSESDAEDKLPFLGFETEVVEEPKVSKKKRKAKKTNNVKTVNLYDKYLDTEDVQLQSHHSESDAEDKLPFLSFETEVVEEPKVSKKKRKAKKTNRAPVAKKPKLDTPRTKLKDTPELKKAAPKIIQNTQNCTSTSFINTKRGFQNSINNIALDTNCRTNSNQDLKPLKCDTCHSSFRYMSELTQHIRIHTGEKPYKCDICQRRFRVRSDLSKHIRIHTGVKPYKCDVCQHSFSRNSYLTEHIIRIHTGEKPYMCDVCQRSFKLKSGLIKHTRTHTGEKPHKCDVCQRSFAQKNILRSHIRIHTGEKPYKCDVCQLSFTQKNNLRNHIRIHTGVKPYKCDVCQRSFKLKSFLISHIRIHTGEKPHKCDVCQRSFAQKNILRSHIRIHTGEKPYKCDVCQLSFTQKNNLRNHILIHTGGKPHKCDVCQRSFAQKNNLRSHIRIHTGEKPYKCDLCQRSFAHKNNLRSHIRIHTGEKPYKCDLCQRSFRERSSLVRHLKTKELKKKLGKE